MKKIKFKFKKEKFGENNFQKMVYLANSIEFYLIMILKVLVNKSKIIIIIIRKKIMKCKLNNNNNKNNRM